MRILAIRGCNLASLAGEFFIDFEADPLASSGIFAITGPTGAGKSTLLDAVCLALFAEIPRLRAAPDRAHVGEDGEETLSAKDTRSILRHGTPEGYAEIDFAMPGGAIYRARWSVRRARGNAEGNLQHYKHSFERLDTAEGMGGTRRETKAAIGEVIGLSAEQFTRAVLLAQGDFEALIRADANERSELLEKLTGSQIYTRLGKRAFEKARELQSGLDAIKARIDALDGLDDDARGAAELRLAGANEAVVTAEAKSASLNAIAQRIQRNAELAGQVLDAVGAEEKAAQVRDEAQVRHVALERDRHAIAMAPLLERRTRAQVAQARAAEDLGSAQEALCKAEDHFAVSASQLDEAAELASRAKEDAEAKAPQLAEARSLDRQLIDTQKDLEEISEQSARKTEASNAAALAAQTAEAAHAIVEARRADAQQWCSANAGFRVVSEREGELLQGLGNLGAARAGKDKEAIRIADLEEAERAGLARHANAAAAEESRREARGLAEQRLRDAQLAAPPAGTLSRLAGRLDLIGTAQRLALQASQARGEVARGDEALTEAEAHKAELDRRQADLAEAIAKNDAQLRPLEARLSSARGFLARAMSASESAAQVMRDALVEGEPCPVCGAIEHALGALDALLGENLATGRREVDELAAACEAMRTKLGVDRQRHEQIGAELVAANAEIDALSNANLDLRGSAAVKHAAALEAAAALEIDGPFDETATDGDGCSLEAHLEASRGQVRGEHEAALAAESSLGEARSAEEAARKAHTETRELLSLAGDSLRAHAQALKEATDEHRRLEAAICERTLDLDRVLAPVTDWQSLAEPEGWLRETAENWRKREKERVAAEAELPALDARRHEAGKAYALALSTAQSCEEQKAKAAVLLDEFAERRGLVLGGDAVEVVEQRLSDRLSNAVQGQDAARTAREACGRSLASAQTTRTACAAALAETQQEHESACAAFTAALASSGFAEADVVRVAGAGQIALDAEAKALAEIDGAFREAVAVLAKCRRDLADHEALHEGCENPSPEELSERLSLAQADLEGLVRQRDEAQFVIRRDNDVREKTAVYRRELAAASDQADVWLRLKEVMGDADGRIMRRFAQGLTLDRLLEHANARLSDLKPRYALDRGTGGDMLIQVIDNDMGGQVRGLHNLSGGERFLVSLALALGLAEMSTTRGVKIESLFIDEGFGALDPVSLGQALGLLEQLHANGRRVGIISHVEDLKERIPVKIEVTPTGRGTSRVEVLGG